MRVTTPSANLLSLDVGKRVRLEDPASGDLVGCVAVVDSVGSDRLVVRLLDPAPDGSFAPGADVVLVVSFQDGLQRAASTVEESKGDHDKVLDLRLPRPLDAAQRRAHPRVPVDLEVRCRPYRPNGTTDVETMTAVDISQGGIRLVGAIEHAAGTVVELELALGASSFVVRGMVVATRPIEGDRWTAHVAFSATTPDPVRHRLARYVADQPDSPPD